jgi:hypothetical protein
MKITTFSRSDVRSINSEIEQAIQSIAKRYGLRIEVGNARYSSTEINTKVKVSVVDTKTGVGITKEAKAYELLAPQNGIRVKLGEEVTLRGKRFIVKGWNTRSPKYPIVAEEVSSGKSYKLNPLSLKYL